jgi:hypothetical protein
MYQRLCAILLGGSLLLPNLSCTSSRSSHAHTLNQPQGVSIELTTCPETFSLLDESVKSPPISLIENLVVRDLTLEVMQRELPNLSLTDAPADLNLTILKAYGMHLHGSKSLVVVMKLGSENLEKAIILRGNTVGVNWWSTDGEFKRGLRSSFVEALRPLKEAYAAACNNKGP